MQPQPPPRRLLGRDLQAFLTPDTTYHRFRRLPACCPQQIKYGPVAIATTNRWFRAVLAEGRNREVRRMVEIVGGLVSRLVRVRFGPVTLPLDLAPVRWLEIDAAQMRSLVQTA